MEPQATDTVKNPLATLIVLTYRHEKFAREALQGAFAQTYQPLEIIVSDDASPDNTWALLEEIAAAYRGPHKLTIRRNEQNLGINRHFNVLMPLVNGEFIVIAAGDDISLPERVATSVQLMPQGTFGVHGNAMVVNVHSSPAGLFRPKERQFPCQWLSMIKPGLSGVVGATLAWRSEVNAVFGPIPESPLGEDAFIPFRCALLGGFAYSPNPLVKYRSHGGNVSFWKALKGGSRRAVGKSVYNHQIRVLRCWENDAEVAYRAGYLDDASYKQALFLIAETRKLFADLECALDMPLFGFVSFAWYRSKNYAHLPNVFSSLIEGYLIYAHLNLYRVFNTRKWPARLLKKLVLR